MSSNHCLFNSLFKLFSRLSVCVFVILFGVYATGLAGAQKLHQTQQEVTGHTNPLEFKCSVGKTLKKKTPSLILTVPLHCTHQNEQIIECRLHRNLLEKYFVASASLFEHEKDINDPLKRLSNFASDVHRTKTDRRSKLEVAILETKQEDETKSFVLRFDLLPRDKQNEEFLFQDCLLMGKKKEISFFKW